MAWSKTNGERGPMGPPGPTTWNEITDKPTSFTPASHTHSTNEVGLSNVDNVKQASKLEFDNHTKDNITHISEAERATWNGKADSAIATTTANGLMSSADKLKLNNIASNANNYIHPPSHPATMITVADAGNLFTATELEGVLNELFTNVSNGKNQIATAITDKGVPASGGDTFSLLANKIGQISGGKKYASGRATPSTLLAFQNSAGGGTTNLYSITVSGLGFVPSLVVITDSAGNGIFAIYDKRMRIDLRIHLSYERNFSSSVNHSLKEVTPVSIVSGGFTLPASPYNSFEMNWIAFE